MSEINDDIDWQLLERYLAGEASPTEQTWLRAWLDEDASRQQQLELFRRVWAHSRSQPNRYDAEEGWREVTEQLKPAADVTVRAFPGRSVGKSRPRPWRQTLVRIAAVLAVAAGGGVLTEAVHQRMQNVGDAAAMREIATPGGQRASVRLADGSRVTLGPESRLVAPGRFDRKTRTVTLVGEGFFEVAHDEDRPFLIHTGEAVTRVLGTSFGLRAYPGDSAVRVAVRTGRVRLHSATTPDSGAELTAGDVGRLDGRGRVAVESGADVDAYLAWTRDQLVFRDTELRQVAADLERWYDIDVAVVDDEIADLPLTARFDHQPLDEVLTVISRTLDVRCVRDGRTVRIRKAERV